MKDKIIREHVKMNVTGVSYKTIGNIQNLPVLTTSVMLDETEGKDTFTREDFFKALGKVSKPLPSKSDKS